MTITRFTKEQTVNFIAEQLPQGSALASKYCDGSNLRRYLSGASVEFKRFQDTMALFLEELDPRTTNLYIEEWESALSIPDSCIPLATTDQERRDNIILKLTSLSIQTEEDLSNLASQFGFTISFQTDDFPPYNVPFTPKAPVSIGFPPYSVPFLPIRNLGSRYVIVIRGDFSSDPAKASIFQCLVELLIPANYLVAFINV